MTTLTRTIRRAAAYSSLSLALVSVPLLAQQATPKHHSKLKGALAGAAAGHVLGGHAVAGAAAGAMVQHERNHHHGKIIKH